MRNLVFLVFLALTSAQVTDPGLLPGFSNLQGCVQSLFSDTGEELLNDIGCDNWFCVCNHFSDAFYTVSTMAISQCNTQAQDVMQATSVLNSFCTQIPTPSSVSPPAGLTDPSKWPGFSTLRICVQYLFSDTGEELLSYLNCGNWICACQDSGAGYTLSSMAATQCVDAQDKSIATSLFTAFCNQISLTPVVPTAPTSVGQDNQGI